MERVRPSEQGDPQVKNLSRTEAHKLQIGTSVIYNPYGSPALIRVAAAREDLLPGELFQGDVYVVADKEYFGFSDIKEPPETRGPACKLRPEQLEGLVITDHWGLPLTNITLILEGVDPKFGGFCYGLFKLAKS